MRECVGYREQIEALALVYPGKVSLTISETAKALGIDRRTVKALIERKKLYAIDISMGDKYTRYLIPITAIAKILTKERTKI